MVRSERRPNTATLTKPTVLDSRLLGIFDMSTVSREHLLAIKNLVHSTPRCKCKPMAKTFSLRCGADINLKSAAPLEADHKIPKMYKVLNRTYRIRTNVRQRLHELTAAAADADDDTMLKATSPVIPAPCFTCGRSEQPERFHSHPSRVEAAAVAAIARPAAAVELEKRKTVQKPVAMKFRSSKTKNMEAVKEREPIAVKGVAEGQPSPVPASKPIKSPRKVKGPAPQPPASLPADSSPPAAPSPPPRSPTKSNVQRETPTAKSKMKLCSRWRDAIKKSVKSKRETKAAAEEATKVQQTSPRKVTLDLQISNAEGGYKLDTWNPAPVSAGRTRKVVCYLCSQEFGTATLPSHEAQCVQKYLKEITDSDNSLKSDEIDHNKETVTTAQENWKLAWEITQASLMPCEFCDRKFLPARLEAHQKICGSKINRESSKNKPSINTNISQPGILCENCGKRYGSSSIVIHREQCIKKSQMVVQQASAISPQPSSRKPTSPVIVICYICGRNFGTKSIAFHEPQCLKKWKMENDKLPTELQRPDPIKLAEYIDPKIHPDSQELFWKVHQAQLVPCPKCARTFYPDRLEVHLKGCKGPPKNKNK